MKLIDETGNRYGKLTVQRRLRPDELPASVKEARWLCQCDCGNINRVAGAHLRSGMYQSCQCGSLYAGSQRQSSIGASFPSEKRSWLSMRSRCNNPNNHAYARYGGRGIEVCASWKFFKNFLKDMGPKPSPEFQIERINNDGNYEPRNCKWATPFEQSNNKRNNKRLSVGREILTVSQWSKVSGVKPDTIAKRIRKGIPTEQAIFTLPKQ